jgi:hypothetical protein
VAFGVMAFIFPMAFFYISQLVRQSQAIYSEIELQEAAANVKSFLDVSENVSRLAEKNIYIGVARDGKFLLGITPLSWENLLPGVSFMAQKCDTLGGMISERANRKVICSSNNGIWRLCCAKNED